MSFDFLLDVAVAPKKGGAPTKDKDPVVPIWTRYLQLSQETIAESIQEWKDYIDKPSDRAVEFYAAKNWTILNRDEFAKGKPALVSVSMTVGKTAKFNVLPKVKWVDGKPTKDGDNKVGKMKIQQDAVTNALAQFQATLKGLSKDTPDGKVFWEQAKSIAKPKSKAKHTYHADQDLWIKD